MPVWAASGGSVLAAVRMARTVASAALKSLGASEPALMCLLNVAQ